MESDGLHEGLRLAKVVLYVITQHVHARSEVKQFRQSVSQSVSQSA